MSSPLLLLVLAVVCGVTQVTHGFNMREMVDNLIVVAEGKHNPHGEIKSLENHRLFHYMNGKFGGDSKKPILMKTFTWSDCGVSDEVANISTINVSPDPIVLPGTINFSFSGTLKANVDAPLKLQITLEKDIIFGWVTIPCIDGLGSCTYDDLCEKLEPAVCPTDINCKCPFAKGNYNFASPAISVDQSVPHGKYRVKAELSENGKAVACLAISADIE